MPGLCLPMGVLQTTLIDAAVALVVGETKLTKEQSAANTYRARKKGLYVVGKNFFLLNCSAWLLLNKICIPYFWTLYYRAIAP